MKIKSSGLVLAALLGVFAGARGAACQTLDQMISPVTNPVNFEDPRALTELRAIYLYHELDNEFVTQGGNVQIYALQARWAINDRLSLIATKDGYVIMHPDAVLNDESGIANIEAGLKYALYKTDSSIFSGILRYEIPLGDEDVLQGEGDGFIHPSVSAATAWEGFNFMAGTGFRIPLDNSDSTFYDFDIHVDHPFGGFYPLLELNVVNVVDAGDRLPIADEGQDFFSIGSSEADGKTIVTMGVGARYRISDNIDIGAAYQFPLSSGDGSRIIDWRVTTDLVFHI